MLVEGPVNDESRPLTAGDMPTLARLLRMKEITNVTVLNDSDSDSSDSDSS